MRRASGIWVVFAFVAGCSSSDSAPPAGANDASVPPADAGHLVDASSSDGGAIADAGSDVATSDAGADASPPGDAGLDAADAALTYPQVVLADHPVGYWRLGETSGTVAHDASGNGLDGAYQGGVALGGAGPIAGGGSVTIASGKYVSVPDDARLAPAAITIECWVSPAAIPPPNPPPSQIASLVTKGDSAYRLQVDGRVGWKLALGLTTSGDAGIGASYVDVEGPVATAAQWTHVVGTFDGTTGRLYVNGVPAASKPFPAPLRTDSFPLMIGENGEYTGRYFEGSVAEVAVYGAALSDGQIAAHYAAAH